MPYYGSAVESFQLLSVAMNGLKKLPVTLPPCNVMVMAVMVMVMVMVIVMVMVMA